MGFESGVHAGVTAVPLIHYDTNQFHLPPEFWGFAEAGIEDRGNLPGFGVSATPCADSAPSPILMD